MIAALIAMQVMQPQPTTGTNPALVKPNSIAIARLAEPQRKLAEARELIDRAELVLADYVPRAGLPTRAELEASIEQLRHQRDSLAELGEKQQLRMQMVMDRMSKADSALAEMLKRIDDTQNSIVQNIK